MLVFVLMCEALKPNLLPILCQNGLNADRGTVAAGIRQRHCRKYRFCLVFLKIVSGALRYAKSSFIDWAKDRSPEK